MKDILSLSFELQAVLVFGYMGYSIASIGHKSSHSFEDRALQILTFGFISLILFKFSSWTISSFPFSKELQLSDAISKVVQAMAMLLFSIISAAIWKIKGKGVFSQAMKALGVANEDYYPTTLSSIMHGHSKFTWDYVNLHMNDGRTIQSDMAMLGADGVPGNIPLIDEAGNVAIYVTKIFSPANEDARACKPRNESGSYKLSYYPKEQIGGIEVCWRSPT